VSSSRIGDLTAQAQFGVADLEEIGQYVRCTYVLTSAEKLARTW